MEAIENPRVSQISIDPLFLERWSPMAGFDRDRAFTALNIPKGYHVEAASAIGRRADKSILPESLRKREHPNSRHELETIV